MISCVVLVPFTLWVILQIIWYSRICWEVHCCIDLTLLMNKELTFNLQYSSTETMIYDSLSYIMWKEFTYQTIGERLHFLSLTHSYKLTRIGYFCSTLSVAKILVVPLASGCTAWCCRLLLRQYKDEDSSKSSRGLSGQRMRKAKSKSPRLLVIIKNLTLLTFDIGHWKFDIWHSANYSSRSECLSAWVVSRKGSPCKRGISSDINMKCVHQYNTDNHLSQRCWVENLN